jgi:hypothetical protein
METFHVYVVGAVNASSPDAIAKVAEGMASRYGLPADDLLGRLSRGRFRVKANVDRATADALKKDLESLGARVLIEAGTGASDPQKRPTPQPRASTPPPLQSGLSAAFGDNPASADLGALANLDNGLALSSIDGTDESKAPASFGPPMSASIGPAAPPAATGKGSPPKPKDLPVDMQFAPPDEGAELKMDIAADELEHKAKKQEEQRRRQTPPAGVPLDPPARPTPPQRPSQQPRLKTDPVAPLPAPPKPRGRLGPLSDERIRFAVGIGIAILLGLLPAHLIASSWEGSAYGRVDAKVEQQQKMAETADDYAALDAYRDRALDQKKSERRNIAMVGMLIWAAAGAGIAYAWFKRVPWDRLDAPA